MDSANRAITQCLRIARRATLYATRAAMRANVHPWPSILMGDNRTAQMLDSSGEFLFSAVGVAGAVAWPELVATAGASCGITAQGDAADVALALASKGTGQLALNSPGGGVTLTGQTTAQVAATTGTLSLVTNAAQSILFYTTSTLRWIINANGALQGAAAIGTLPLQVERAQATQNDVQDAASLVRTSSGGAGQAGIGVGLLFQAEGAAAPVDTGRVQARLTNVGVGTEVSAVDVQTRTGGAALGTTATFAGDGNCTLTGDIQAAGGYRQTLGPWQEVDVAAGKADAVVPITPTAGAIAGVPVVRAGSVVGIVAILDAALTSTDAFAATITVSLHINGGAALAETCVLDAPGGGGAGEALQITLIAKDLRALAAGDIITVSTASSANITGAARDLTVMVQIEG